MAPLFICLKFTAPVLDDRLEVSWNKPLTLLQCLAIPWLWFLLLKQYEEPWFGETPESTGFPRYGCAFIGNIILVTIIALTTNLYHPPGIFKIFCQSEALKRSQSNFRTHFKSFIDILYIFLSSHVYYGFIRWQTKLLVF